MNKDFQFIAFLVFTSSVRCAHIPKQNVTIEIANGMLDGERRGHFYAFEGIPYAEAPMGDLRFEPPKPYTQKWSEPRDAKKAGSACMQWNHLKLDSDDKLVGSEDCLFINVYTPSLEREKRLPVFVYIHGGAFMFGHGDKYGPELITERGGIVVNFNYRLGPFGFLTTEDEVVPGNMGLKDQVEALKWVQKNIAAFGGDPDQVTLTGFSAGGASVHLHYFSPLSVGLFKNGISHSGCALNPWVFMEKGKERAQKLAKIVSCSPEEMIIDCLKGKPAEDIVRAVKQFQPWLYNPFSPFAATVEPQVAGAFLTEKPINLIIEGKFQRLPWLASATEAEGLYPAAEFLKRKEYLPYIDEHWNEVMPLILHYNDTIPAQSLQNVSEEIRHHYLGKDKLNDTTVSDLIDMVSDRMYNYGISQAIRVHGTVAPAFFYHFRYKTAYSIADFLAQRSDFDFGVAHGEDIELLYSNPIRNESRTHVTDDIKMIGKLLDMYFSFSKTGVPSLGNYTIPLVKLNKGNYLRHASIDGPDTIFTADLDDFGEEEFWTSIDFDENIPDVTVDLVLDIVQIKRTQLVLSLKV